MVLNASGCDLIPGCVSVSGDVSDLGVEDLHTPLADRPARIVPSKHKREVLAQASPLRWSVLGSSSGSMYLPYHPSLVATVGLISYTLVKREEGSWSWSPLFNHHLHQSDDVS